MPLATHCAPPRICCCSRTPVREPFSSLSTPLGSRLGPGRPGAPAVALAARCPRARSRPLDDPAALSGALAAAGALHGPAHTPLLPSARQLTAPRSPVPTRVLFPPFAHRLAAPVTLAAAAAVHRPCFQAKRAPLGAPAACPSTHARRSRALGLSFRSRRPSCIVRRARRR